MVLGLGEPNATSGVGTTLAPPLPSAAPCDWREGPSLGRAVGEGGRGPRPKVTLRQRRCGESQESEPRHFECSPPLLCGEWRRDGARGERRQRGFSRTPAADPQLEARAAGGQRDPVPQLHFSLLLPRYRPRPAPAHCAPRRGRPAPLPLGAGGVLAVPPAGGCLRPGRRFPLPRSGAGSSGQDTPSPRWGPG